MNQPDLEVDARGAPTVVRPDIEVLPGPPPPTRPEPASAGGPEPSSAPVGPGAPSRRHLLVLGALMVFALGVSLATSKLLFPRYSLNHDEPMYVVESRMLLQGHVTLPAQQAEFLRPWAAGVRHGRVVMKYAPPWPAVIAASKWTFGTDRFAPALVAAGLVAVVYLLATEVFPRRRVGLLAAALFALSPVVIVQSGTYLPYLFQLLLELLFAYLVLSGVRRGSWRRLVGAGAAIGVAVFARPFDAVLIGLPFVAWVVVSERGRWAVAARRLVQVGVGALPFVGLMLAYDQHTMGSPLTLPFTVTGRFDTLGFGRRGVFPDHTFHFGFPQAVGSLENLWALPGWMFGGLLVVGLAVVGLVRWRSAGGERWTVLALAALAVTVTVGYFFFWSPFTIARSWPGLVDLGAFYHLPVLVPVVIFAGAALEEGLRRPPFRVAAGVAAVAMVGLTAFALPPKVDRNRAVTRDFRAVARVVAPATRVRSVVFLPEGGDDGFSSPTPFLDTLPDLGAPVLYATDRGARDLAFLDTVPGRASFVLHNEIPARGQVFSPKLVLTRMEVRRGPSAVEHLHVVNPGGGTCVTAYAAGATTTRRIVLDRHSAPGSTYDVTWSVDAPSRHGSAGSPWSIVPLPASSIGEVALGVGFGSSCDFGAAERYERRFAVRTPDATGTEIELADPGQGWHEARLAGRAPFWVREHVDGVIGRIGSTPR